MKNAKERVKIHTPYIICNDMMYKRKLQDFSIMTNSVANNGNPFGAADYAKNRNRILETGIASGNMKAVIRMETMICQ